MSSNGKMYTTVMEKLNFEPQLDASNITVSIQGDNDIVILVEQFSSYMKKLIIEKAVKNLSSKKSIVNNITIKPSISKVKAKITKEFECHAKINTGKITVITEGRKKILRREVNTTLDEIDKIEDTVWSVTDVEEMQNNLTIE